MRIGMVLGGGGYTGTAFHAGVLTALAETAGFDARSAELLVGTSAGATVAALTRSGFPPQEYVARMTGAALSAEAALALGGIPPLAQPPARASARRWKPAEPHLAVDLLRNRQRYPWGIWATALLPEGTVPTEATGARMGPGFREWPTQPTWLTAVNLADGARVVFGRDSEPVLGDAVAASCAVPGYFAPVKIDGSRYVDGGAHSIMNLDLVAGLGLDLVIASAPMAMAATKPSRLSDLARLPAARQLQHEVSLVQDGGTQVRVIAPDAHLMRVMGLNSMQVKKRPVVARATKRYVQELLAASPLSCTD